MKVAKARIKSQEGDGWRCAVFKMEKSDSSDLVFLGVSVKNDCGCRSMEKGDDVVLSMLSCEWFL